MSDQQICYLDLSDVAREIHSGQRSSLEVTQAILERIDALDGGLRSYATVMSRQALEAARRADDEIAQGQVRGVLHGVPIAVKDLLWTVDAPTSHGMTINKAFQAKEDATVVQRLRNAGAVILGKLQMTEGAFGSHHPEISVPVNPWGNSLWPGVSSSGSGVATAAGLCFASLGTDTGGSIRYPSAANGITGVKPTWGRVSRHGAFALAASMDHIGPMARSAADAAAVLQVISGSDAKDPTASLHPVPNYSALMTRGLDGLTVGLDPRWALGHVDAATQTVLQDAIKKIELAGGAVHEVRFPEDEQLLHDWSLLCAVETAVEHESTFPSRREEYGPSLAGLIEMGHRIDALAHQKRLMHRLEFRGRLDALFASVDLLLAPVTEVSGMKSDFVHRSLSDPDGLAAILRYTGPFDMAGHPTLTLPGGITADGAPIGFQFVAPHFGEDFLLRAGWAFQQVTDWHRRHPSL